MSVDLVVSYMMNSLQKKNWVKSEYDVMKKQKNNYRISKKVEYGKPQKKKKFLQKSPATSSFLELQNMFFFLFGPAFTPPPLFLVVGPLVE